MFSTQKMPWSQGSVLAHGHEQSCTAGKKFPAPCAGGMYALCLPTVKRLARCTLKDRFSKLGCSADVHEHGMALTAPPVLT